ncbi:MAG: GMC family oxidoreductase [Actinomycetota bacterium]
MAGKAIVIGSGAGGSTAAMVLAEAGYDVVILEKGRNYFRDLTSPTPKTLFANDELKAGIRPFEEPDPEAEPRTYRRSPADEEPFHVGSVNDLPSTVGGGTVHWDAKTPRLWDIDFKKLTMLGPVDGADVQDWPFTYQEIAPFYDEIEHLIGVAGDVDQLAPVTLAHAPRSGPLPMPPGPPQYSSMVAAQGASLMGLHPYPVPMAINSQSYQGRPACNNCGFCSHYGCPIHARVGALAPLRRALLAGAELRAETFVYKIEHKGGRATGVSYVGPDGKTRTERADVVVLAGSTIESNRLALLSQIPDPNAQIGKYLMFHWFTAGFAIFLRERMHAYRGRSTSHAVDDFADPDFPGARLFAAANGLPYIRGGVLELGGTQDPMGEAEIYRGTILPIVSPNKPFGRIFKQLMRASVLRDRFFGLEMIGEDLAQATNAVDLDPTVKDARGFASARITYAPHAHEIAAQTFYIPLITAMLKLAGADASAAVPETSSDRFPVAAGDVPDGKHIMGGLRMGTDPKTSVTNAHGRLHALDNVLVADGSVFPTSGAHNPTLTIMATALRNTRALVGTPKKPSVLGRKQTASEELPATGVGESMTTGAALIATAGALAETIRRSTNSSQTKTDGRGATR